MLSSIHPLGERGRHNRWAITVSSFTVVATATGAAVGAAFGFLGELIFGAVTSDALLLASGAVAVAAGALDMLRIEPPGPERQVNETWVGHYRGWVYAGAFGFELGTGVMTYIVTWGVYSPHFAAELLSAILGRPG